MYSSNGEPHRKLATSKTEETGGPITTDLWEQFEMVQGGRSGAVSCHIAGVGIRSFNTCGL